MLRQLARRLRPYLMQLPQRWSGGIADEAAYDKAGGRVASPSPRRPEHEAVRFRSAGELRRYLGPAPPGYEYHHIVERRLAENGRFPPELIHSTDNIVILPREVHIRVSAEMSRNAARGGPARRVAMEGLEFAAQYDLGIDLIEQVMKDIVDEAE